MENESVRAARQYLSETVDPLFAPLLAQLTIEQPSAKELPGFISAYLANQDKENASESSSAVSTTGKVASIFRVD